MRRGLGMLCVLVGLVGGCKSEEQIALEKQTDRMNAEQKKWVGREAAVTATLGPVVDALAKGDAATLERLLPANVILLGVSPPPTVPRE